jgi:hypothetical protein
MRFDREDHGALALWAADSAEHVLPYFENQNPQDDRPRDAVEAARAWARGEIRVGQARAAAGERDWQVRRLPARLRRVALPARSNS